MTPRRRLPTLTVAALTVAALTALAACGNAPTSPGAVAGTYVVSAVDGEELPQHIGDDGGAPVSLVSLTITLADDATASLRATVRTKGAEGGVDMPLTRAGSWALVHGAVVIEAPPSVLAPSGQLLGVDGNTRLAAGVPGLGSSVVYSLARYRNYVVVR